MSVSPARGLTWTASGQRSDLVILSSYHLVLLFCYPVIPSSCYLVILSSCHLVIILLCYPPVLLSCYPVIPLSCHPVILLCYHPDHLIVLLQVEVVSFQDTGCRPAKITDIDIPPRIVEWLGTYLQVIRIFLPPLPTGCDSTSLLVRSRERMLTSSAGPSEVRTRRHGRGRATTTSPTHRDTGWMTRET